MDVLSDVNQEGAEKMPVGESDQVEMDPKTVDESSDELEVDDSVKESLSHFLEAVEGRSGQEIELDIYHLCDEASTLAAASNLVRESKEFKSAINETISKMHDMYSCARESSHLDEGVKVRLLDKLESHFKTLKNLAKESVDMNRKIASRKVSRTVDLNEETLNIKVNLPDDVQLSDDAVEVQLPGEETEGDDLAASGGGDEGGDDLGGLDLGGDEGGGDDNDAGEGGDMDMGKDDDDMDEGVYGEGLEFSDDDVIEISESMLRKEIARMKGLNESADDDEDLDEGKIPVDDFGGGEDDGDPWLDHDVTTEAAKSAKKEPKKEGRTNRSSTQPTISEQVAALNRQLAEQKLFNTKLLCTNKLLQQEGLTAKQKLKIAEALDNAQTEREVKLVYKSLSDQIASMKGRSGLQESAGARKVIGSASRATNSASSKSETMNEGLDTNRWAKLAGIL
jgi:hypothetical protein